MVAVVVNHADLTGTAAQLEAAVDAEELRVHCASRLAPFKVPKSFAVVESVPRGATGKLLRRELG